MSGRQARAFQSDIRGAGARRREAESVKSALRGTSLTEAFLERVEAEPEAAHAAQAPRRAAPSKMEQSEEKRVACDRARKEAQAAVARGEADPRQLNWLAKFCKSPRIPSAEVPF